MSASAPPGEVPYKAGQTALVLDVPEAEPLVRPWRAREVGVSAHVTVLTPFLHASLIDDGVRGELRALFGRHPAIDVSFREIRRFPGVVYLAPEPVRAFVRLIEAVAGRWPQTPPYGGLYDDVVPHLTLGVEGAVDEARVAGALPLAARVAAVTLLVRDGAGWWRPVDVFPLAAQRA
ncbi:hypothetical protein GCM10009850_005730 [Nonomuraea monospora]|uniref:2'-5' RNA ligase family protein n=1 Tax=Nonomuraea monospora TaxID=568818 RepID=A0ABN3C695_9ACTN